jgi:hypothetical protein
VENIFARTLHKSRLLLVFGFGLLHGMGFASVLQEFGMPDDAFYTALLSFNAGVELGQLAVISLAFLSVGLWLSRKAWYRQVVVMTGSAAIGVIGLYWTWDRSCCNQNPGDLAMKNIVGTSLPGRKRRPAALMLKTPARTGAWPRRPLRPATARFTVVTFATHGRSTRPAASTHRPGSSTAPPQSGDCLHCNANSLVPGSPGPAVGSPALQQNNAGGYCASDFFNLRATPPEICRTCACGGTGIFSLRRAPPCRFPRAAPVPGYR